MPTLQVKVADEEKAAVEQSAATEGLSVASYIRQFVPELQGELPRRGRPGAAAALAELIEQLPIGEESNLDLTPIIQRPVSASALREALIKAWKSGTLHILGWWDGGEWHSSAHPLPTQMEGAPVYRVMRLK